VGILDGLSALRLLEEYIEAERKNFGDVEAVLKSNPGVNAWFLALVKAVAAEVTTWLDERLPSKDMALFSYKEVAAMLHMKIGALRAQKARGHLKAAPGEGQARFTLKAIEEFKAIMKEREIETTKKRKANMAAVGKSNRRRVA
jgi:hypothetical protein